MDKPYGRCRRLGLSRVGETTRGSPRNPPSMLLQHSSDLTKIDRSSNYRAPIQHLSNIYRKSIDNLIIEHLSKSIETCRASIDTSSSTPSTILPLLLRSSSKIFRCPWMPKDVDGCPWIPMDATRNVENLKNRRSQIPHPPNIENSINSSPNRFAVQVPLEGMLEEGWRNT